MPTKICLVKAMVFPVVMYEYELDHKGWVLKNWCLWTVVLEKTLESPLDSQEIKLVNHKGNQPWMFIGRTDVEAEAPILWPPDAKSPLLLLGKIEGRRRGRQQRMRWLVNGHEFEQTESWWRTREAWCAAVHGVTKSWTQLSNWTTTEAEKLDKVPPSELIPMSRKSSEPLEGRWGGGHQVWHKKWDESLSPSLRIG